MYTKQAVGFIAHPKTGSTSVMSVLLDLGFQQCGGHHDVAREWVDGLWVIGATVRNPWDVMVSWWFHKGNDRKGTFADWLPQAIRDNHFIRQGLFYGLKYATHVLRYESLDHDWVQYLRAAHLPLRALPQHNVGGGRDGQHYREFYTPATRDVVAQAFAAEINQLEYIF